MKGFPIVWKNKSEQGSFRNYLIYRRRSPQWRELFPPHNYVFFLFKTDRKASCRPVRTSLGPGRPPANPSAPALRTSRGHRPTPRWPGPGGGNGWSATACRRRRELATARVLPKSERFFPRPMILKRKGTTPKGGRGGEQAGKTAVPRLPPRTKPATGTTNGRPLFGPDPPTGPG